MKILYENNDLIFVVKPRGVASQPSPKSEDMITLLSEYTKSTVLCVHRLDTATGGVMVYAKNDKSAALLSKAFAEKTIQKEYLAVVKQISITEGEMTDFLWHDKSKNKSFSVKTKRKGAKEAKLSYKVIASDDEKSLVRIKLYTGRTHQIRVQFATRGFPLYGDGKYGGRSGYPLALWCYNLSVPYMGKILSFTADPPEDEELWNIKKDTF